MYDGSIFVKIVNPSKTFDWLVNAPLNRAYYNTPKFEKPYYLEKELNFFFFFNKKFTLTH